jgi:hypothetical protein
MKSIETQKTAVLNLDQFPEKHKAEIAKQLTKQRDLYINAATAENTRKAYKTDIAHFEAWGGVLPASPEIIGLSIVLCC